MSPSHHFSSKPEHDSGIPTVAAWKGTPRYVYDQHKRINPPATDRTCALCPTKLNRYNSHKVCGPCRVKENA